MANVEGAFMVAVGEWRVCIQRRGAEGAEKRFERIEAWVCAKELGFGARGKMEVRRFATPNTLRTSSASHLTLTNDTGFS